MIMTMVMADLEANVKQLRARLEGLGDHADPMARKSLGYAERELTRSLIQKNREHAVQRADYWITAAEEERVS